MLAYNYTVSFIERLTKTQAQVIDHDKGKVQASNVHTACNRIAQYMEQEKPKLVSRMRRGKNLKMRIDIERAE
jgi:hypothetical protein